MLQTWQSLALGAEVGIVADSAFVTVPNNISTLSRTERAVAANAMVNLTWLVLMHNWLVESNEPVAWMSLVCSDCALGAEVPIRTIQAFVTNAENILELD